MIRNAWRLHLSSYYLQSGISSDCAEPFRQARPLGLTTSFDTNWHPAEEWGTDVLYVLDLVDVFLPNEDEVSTICGEDELDRSSAWLRGPVRSWQPAERMAFAPDRAAGRITFLPFRFNRSIL